MSLPDRVLREMTGAELRAYMDTTRVGQHHDRERSLRADALYEELRLLSHDELVRRAGLEGVSYARRLTRGALIADIIEQEADQCPGQP